MKASIVLVILLGWAVPPAAAQPTAKDDLETVIVTAPKLHFGVTPNAVAHDFIRSHAAPTVLREAIARWQVGICPEFRGVAPRFAETMEERFRKIAGEAGAPLKQTGCRPNMSVVFTAQPQAMLDAIQAKNLDALGYHGATTVTHAVQAWYETGITDLDGITELDRDDMGSVDDTGCHGQKGGGICWTLPTRKVGGLAWSSRSHQRSAQRHHPRRYTKDCVLHGGRDRRLHRHDGAVADRGL